MNSERIKTLASFITKDDTVLDVGCDHGYLSIYLKQNNLCKDVYASDVSSNALEYAKSNFQKYDVDIKSYVSDGFNNIDIFFDTAVIAGMGANTIINILKNKKTPSKLILGSNNDYYVLRKYLNQNNYVIKKEKIVKENNHYYVIMLALKGKEKLTKRELLFGKSNNKEYYNHLLNERKKIIKKVPFSKKIKLSHECFLLKSLIEKK